MKKTVLAVSLAWAGLVLAETNFTVSVTDGTANDYGRTSGVAIDFDATTGLTADWAPDLAAGSTCVVDSVTLYLGAPGLIGEDLYLGVYTGMVENLSVQAAATPTGFLGVSDNTFNLTTAPEDSPLTWTFSNIAPKVVPGTNPGSGSDILYFVLQTGTNALTDLGLEPANGSRPFRRIDGTAGSFSDELSAVIHASANSTLDSPDVVVGRALEYSAHLTQIAPPPPPPTGPPEWDSAELVYSLLAERPYTNSIASHANDPDGDPMSFFISSGPSWLNMDPSGIITGTPLLANLGTNTFSIGASAIDGDGYTTLKLIVNAVPSDGLVAYYNFDNATNLGENTGPVSTEWDGFSATATTNALFGSGSAQFPGWCLDTDFGADTALDFSSFSVSMQVRGGLNDWTDYMALGTTANQINLEQNGKGSVSVFYVGSPGGEIPLNILGTNSVTDGMWHQIGLVSDGTNLTLYVDGVSIGTAAYTGSGIINSIQLGNRLGGGRQSEATIDDVGVWNIALGANDMADLAAHPIGDKWYPHGPVTDLTLGLASGNLVFSWTAESGAIYGIETNGNLFLPSWGPMASGLSGSGPMSVAYPIGAEPKLFYRVITE